jgi:hypothetical protein
MKLKHVVCLALPRRVNAVDLNTSDKPKRLVPRTVFGSNLRRNKEYHQIFLNFFLPFQVYPGTRNLNAAGLTSYKSLPTDHS